MAGKPVTIRDVARLAGVSPATVSNALSGRKPVGEVLAERVKQAARDLSYEVDRAASQLRTGRAKILAVLVPDLDNPFFTAVIAAIESCVRHSAYEVIVASSNGEIGVENSRLSAILAWRPAAVVVIPCSDLFPGRSLLELANVPYVIADRVTDAPSADTVSVDNEAAGALGAQHLVDLGHSRILIAASVLELANIRERCAGAAELLRRYDLPAPSIVETGLSFETAAEKLSQWFDSNDHPTAVLALTNFATLGVLAALAERRVAIPQQMSVIGFDDYSWMRARATPLTALGQPVREMGEAIWDRLQARIDGDRSPPIRVQLSCELKVRASTARPPEPKSARLVEGIETKKTAQRSGPAILTRVNQRSG